ncbi:MAG TPA: DinB family protein [Flavipsychrobacter sp.]|nr:DinB family protein [Flavipsychrobacter sp.]
MEIKTVGSFMEYYERVRGRTLRLLRIIPPEQIDWAYKEDKYSIADTIRHIAAMERYMFAENVIGHRSRYNGCGKELADGYDEVMAFFNEMHKQSMEMFRTLSNEDLTKKCVNPAGQIVIWKWLRAMIEHEIHHRGQIYVYLGMLGVKTPPIFGLTAEEVQELSINKYVN